MYVPFVWQANLQSYSPNTNIQRDISPVQDETVASRGCPDDF